MINKIGIKTTTPELVAYKVLKPEENEIVESARLSRLLHKKDARPSEPHMIIYYDPKDSEGCRREVRIPIQREIPEIDFKITESTKVAFLLFVGTDKPVEYYYDELNKYIKINRMKPSTQFCSIEALFQPEEYGLSYGDFIDEDAAENWMTEIMIPVES